MQTVKTVINRIDRYARSSHWQQVDQNAKDAEERKRQIREQEQQKARDEAAAVASELDNWIASSHGQAFRKMIARDRLKALEELAAADASDIDNMRLLQQIAQIVDKIEEYISKTLLALKRIE